MMVCGQEGDRWLDDCLNQWHDLVDDAIIVTNNATKKEKSIIKKHGYWQYEDNREWGLYQPLIKTDLLAKVGKLKPDWVLPLDADEFYDSSFNRGELDKLMNTGDIAFYFYIVNLWNDPTHYRKYLSFWNIRLFRYAPEYGLTFIKKNVHPGLAPPVAYHYGSYAPFIIKHYGLMKPEDRQKKVERYQKYDPQGKMKSKEQYYDELLRDVPGTTFVESEIQNKIRAEWKPQKPKIINAT